MAEHTIHEAAEASGITVRSVRNYLRLYRDHLSPNRGSCNALLFDDADVETLVKIRALLRQGKTRDEIQRILSGEEPESAMVVTRRPDSLPPAGTEELVEQLRVQNQLLERLVADNLAMRERLDVMEVRLGLRLALPPQQVEADAGSGQLPATVPRQVPVRRRGEMSLAMPYFLLRVKDGAQALLTGMAAALRPRRRRATRRST